MVDILNKMSENLLDINPEMWLMVNKPGTNAKLAEYHFKYVTPLNWISPMQIQLFYQLYANVFYMRHENKKS
jgi:hypothetical protein